MLFVDMEGKVEKIKKDVVQFFEMKNNSPITRQLLKEKTLISF